MRKVVVLAVCLTAVFLAVQAGVVLADTITIDAATDVWIRQASPDKTYEDDSVSVWSNDSAGEGAKRRGAVEFDLSGITQTITGAYLRCYATVNPPVNGTAAVEFAASLQVHGTLSSITWNNMGTYTAGAVDLEGLGYFDLPADQPGGQYYSSNNATANDLIELEAQRTSTDKKLTLFLLNQSGSGLRDWADAAHGGAVQLVVTTVPEPATTSLFMTGLLGLLAYAWRRQK